MSKVFKKLQEARVRLHNTKLNKSGKNSFAKFNYFELGDFIPQVTSIFNDLGLCAVVSFTADTAYLTVHNVEGENDFVTFTSPLIFANMDRVQAIQNLGSTHTYMRRYLWLMAMEIVENDAIDAAEPVKYVEPTKPVVKKDPPKEEPKEEVKEEPKLEGKSGSWQISVSNSQENWDVAVKEATDVLLQLVESADHVNEIFKTNRNIYDKLKAENKEIYDAILLSFKTNKEKWSK